MPVCSKCGAELPNDAKFCFSCGAPQHTADEKEFFFIRNEKEPSNAEGSFTDPRDGEVYKTCKIGDQIWMAENLRYRCKKGGSYAYDDAASNVPKYGRLYEWDVAEEACPPGWVLPSNQEIEEMLKYVKKEYDYDISDVLRAKDWKDGMDAYGFTAVPAGACVYFDHERVYRQVESCFYIWSSSGGDFMICTGDDFFYPCTVIEDRLCDVTAISIRCVKDTPQRKLRLREVAEKARAERLEQYERELIQEREEKEQQHLEKRNNAIRSIIVGVVFAAALMYISQDIIASIILGIGSLLHYFFTPNLKAFLCLFIGSALVCAIGAFLWALLVSTYSWVPFSSAFVYAFVIATPLVMILLKKMANN